MASAGLGIASGFPFKIGVGQIVQRHRGFQPEEGTDPTEQGLFQGGPMLDQGVRGAIQRILGHRFEIHLQQLPQTALPLQPAPRRSLRARVRHAPDDHAQNDRPERTRQPQTGQ